MTAMAWISEPGGWQESALCAQTDPEAFYPEKGGTAEPAKRVCAACPVRRECLAEALLTRDRFGIWGGLAERERRPLTRDLPVPGSVSEDELRDAVTALVDRVLPDPGPRETDRAEDGGGELRAAA